MSLWGAVGLTVGAVGLLSGSAGSARAQAQPAPNAAVVVEASPEPALADATVTADVQARLEMIKVLHNAQLTIVTKDGVVTLAGMIPSEFARRQALDAARATPGVVHVEDMLRLNVASPSAPSQN